MNVSHEVKTKNDLVGFRINVLTSLYNSRLDGIVLCILEGSELCVPCQFKNKVSPIRVPDSLKLFIRLEWQHAVLFKILYI